MILHATLPVLPPSIFPHNIKFIYYSVVLSYLFVFCVWVCVCAATMVSRGLTRTVSVASLTSGMIQIHHLKTAIQDKPMSPARGV